MEKCNQDKETILLLRDDGGLYQVMVKMDIVKIEPMRFANRICIVEGEGRDAQGFGLSNWKEKVTLVETGKSGKEQVWKGWQEFGFRCSKVEIPPRCPSPDVE